MRRQRFAKSSGWIRALSFGLFGGHMSGLVLMGVSLVLILASSARPEWFSMPRSVVSDRLAPALSVLSRPFVALAAGLDHLYTLTKLSTEVQNLRADNKRLEEWYNAAQLLQAENQSLRDLMKVKVDSSLSFITARVVGDAGGPYSQTILVGAGVKDGVQKGNAVLAGEGVLGRVVDVNTETCFVMLMTDVNSRIPVRIEGSHTQAILAGMNDGDLVLDRLPDGVVPRAGQRLLTSGIGGIFPPDLPVGQVEAKGEVSFIVRPYANFGRIVFVRIVKTPDVFPLPKTGEQK